MSFTISLNFSPISVDFFRDIFNSKYSYGLCYISALLYSSNAKHLDTRGRAASKIFKVTAQDKRLDSMEVLPIEIYFIVFLIYS